ncbi:dihydromonapterin reductase [Shewanella halotolerans]|uniref:dihydromonapterin reductase n=1 Tax=Shewanella halotolerans TaxID=2864204 RepID=UPI001C6598AD|nr:dihydromonapterin reductase [Shewanella halotolerans]QYJ90086.1 dihydromonapterin reductase [Shewanella halotolerans]
MQKTILITGVGKRIGLYLAKAFLARGHRVIGTYRSHYPSIDALTELGAELYPCDFTDQTQLEALIQTLAQNYQQLDAVIHNASLWLSDDDTAGVDQVIAQMMQVHVYAPYQLNLALAQLLQNPETMTDIIHITDYVAQKGSKKHIAYAASKAALENMTLSFAAKLAPQVKVNAIAPALISFNEQDDAAYREKAKAKSVLAREGGEVEVLEAIDYLMQSQYVTGRSLALDGGRHLK